MKLSRYNIQYLTRFICGDSGPAPYKTAKELGKLFYDYPCSNFFGDSRANTTDNKLTELNNTEHLKNLLEDLLNPREFKDADKNIEVAVNELNGYLKDDKYLVRKVGNSYKVFETSEAGVNEKVKNIIFASNGPKPEIILSDSISNDIKIVKNEEYCLVYDKDIPDHGLTWSDLAKWWQEKNKLELSESEIKQSLYKRLKGSIGQNQPELLFFSKYYNHFHPILKENLPALIPQVYLHYDPKTVQELKGEKRLTHQRMDFLMLLKNNVRIVIEIDGKQHYSDGEVSSPKKYSELVSYDRNLKLSGYEIFRFGGYELSSEHEESIIVEFFYKLMKRYSILSDG